MGRTASGVLGMLRSRVVTGAAAGDLTVTGIKLGDKLVLVQQINAAAAETTDEFTVTADDTINNTGGTSSAAGLVLVVWEKYEGGKDSVRQPVGRSQY